MTKEAELLPCPFCGANAGVAQTDKGVELGLPKGLFVLACTKCETGWSNISLDALIAKWNTRAASPPVQIEDGFDQLLSAIADLAEEGIDLEERDIGRMIGLTEAAQIVETEWVNVSVGKVPVERQAEYERGKVAQAIRDRITPTTEVAKD